MTISRALMTGSILLAGAAVAVPTEAGVNAWTMAPGAWCYTDSAGWGSFDRFEASSYSVEWYTNGIDVYCPATSRSGGVTGATADRALARVMDASDDQEITLAFCWKVENGSTHCGEPVGTGDNTVGTVLKYLDAPSSPSSAAIMWVQMDLQSDDVVWQYQFEDCTSSIPFCP